MNWPVYKSKGIEDSPVKTVRLTDYSVPLWKWGVARCAKCGFQLKLRRNILDGQLQRLSAVGDEPCECFRLDSDGVVLTGGVVIWNEEREP